MKKNVLLVFLALVMVTCLALTACTLPLPEDDDKGWGEVFTLETAYAEAQSLGYTGSLTDFLDSIKGKDGQNGEPGADGIGIKLVAVNSEGKLIVTLSNDIVIDCGSVKGEQGPAGPQGNPGEDGTDGITPQLKIGADNYWYISYDNGATWANLAVKATGADGNQGEVGPQGPQGNPGQDGTDGITPQLKIGEDNYWYVSYDNGATWACLGVKATGNDGADGEQGETGNGIASIEKTNTEGLVDTYTITFTDGTTTTFTVTNGKDGQDGAQGIQGVPGVDGHTPVITIQNGYWYIDGVNTHVLAEGIKGETGNGISSIEKTSTEGLVDTYTITFTDGATTTFTVTNGKDGEQGAQGIQGIQGVPGVDGHTPVITIQDGYWYIDGVNTNVLAEGIKGETGNGISSIEKTSTEGLVDTYTITFTDGTTTTFTVTNGKDGQDGAQGIQGIQGVPGVDGHTPVITIQGGYWYIDGVNTNVLAEGIMGETGNGISSIEKTNTEGLVDTYTITFTDGSTTTFTVTNGKDGQNGAQGIQGEPGKDGHTPVITIQNGYWYIDGVNTNVLAEGIKGETGNGIASIEKTSTEGLVDTYTITFTDGTTTTFTVTNGKDGQDGAQGIQGIQGEPGKDGHTPVITIQGGYWYIDGVNTNVLAEGIKGETGNGIASIDKTSSEGLVDTYTITFTDGTTTTFTVTNGKDGEQGVQGIQGIQGEPGKDGHTPVITIQGGYWYIDGVNTNVLAEGLKGETGNGISSIEKTLTEGLVDTYTITFTDGTTTTFTVTNGSQGEVGPQGPSGVTPLLKIGEDNYWYVSYDNGTTWTSLGIKATGADGADGEQGETGPQGPQGVSIVSTAFDKDGNMVITYSDGTTQIIEHTWEKLYTLIQPGCVTEGKDLYSCVDCSLVRVVTTSSTGHVDGEWITDTDPTCTAEGRKHQVCANCGITLAIESIGIIEHNYVNNVCSICGVREPSTGLQYDYYYSGYTVSGIGCCTDSDIVIPANYNGLPVIAISDQAFQNRTNLTSVIIPDSVTSIGERAFSCCKNLTNVTIPANITHIGDVAFQGTGLTSVVIPGTVSSIGYYTFGDCSYLTNVEISDGVTSISEKAFAFCSSLTSIVIPQSVTSIGVDAFLGSASLESIIVAEGNTVYDSRNGCNAIIETDTNTLILGSLNTIIPNTVTKIGNGAFFSQKITEIEIPNSVKIVGDEAFLRCSNLVSVQLPNSIESIGFHAFGDCGNLLSIELPNSLKSIGNGVFNNDTKLSSVVIPNTIESIPSQTFMNCVSLHSIEIPESVTSIGGNAFYGCENLRSVTIPDSVTSIGRYAFQFCHSLTIYCEAESQPNGWVSGWCQTDRPIYWGTSSQEIISVDSYQYIIQDDGVIITRYIGDENQIEIPSAINVNGVDYNVTSIGESAFSYSLGLFTITIPNSITSIGRDAFKDCINLTIYCEAESKPNGWVSGWCQTDRPIYWGTSSQEIISVDSYQYIIQDDGVIITRYIGDENQIEIPSAINVNGVDYNVTSIGKSAFSSTRGLSSVVIPDSVTSIEQNAFGYCTNLRSVTIPDSVTSIGLDAFQLCHSLTIYCEAESQPNGWVSGWCQTDRPIYWGYSLQDVIIVDDIQYVIQDGEAIVTGFIGDKNQNVIHSVINVNGVDYNVTSIDDYAFYNCNVLTNITIPDSITSIGSYAFSGSNLTSITIPASITSIGSSAFKLCSSLTNVTFEEGSQLVRIDDNTFAGCSSLISITIPASVTSIGNNAFGGVSSLATISCFRLTTVTFEECSQLISIGETAFAGCSSLISIVIPASVTSIGAEAFNGCTHLLTVTFEGGSQLTSVGEYAFLYCDTLTRVEVSDISFWWNIDFANQSSNPLYLAHRLYLNDEEITEIVVPAGVTSIGNYQFSGCTSLTSITIPDSVTSIGEWAFALCENLSRITIPASVSSIGNYAFYRCESLTSITIPEGVTSIGNYAFYSCESLTSITIPEGVTSIGDYAFIGCISLANINVDSNNQQYKSIDGNLYSKDGKTLIQYAIGKTNTSFTISSGVTSIGSYAFYNCKSLTSITIPDSVTSICSYAFYNCSSLTSITIPDSVTSIGEAAFEFCRSLTSITIPNSVTSIGISAFAYCSSLTSITIPDGVTSIGISAFHNCKGLTSVTIGNSVVSIGARAFSACRSLTSITIPDSVTSIGDSAFYNCSSLANVYYAGTEEQWTNISIGSSNTYLTNATITYNYTEE